MSQGEFVALTKGLREVEESSGVLQAWWHGEPVDADDLHLCFESEILPIAETDAARNIAETVLSRLETHFRSEIAGAHA
jgi:hypothetical protein